MTARETRGGLLVGAMAEGDAIRRRRFEALFEENFRPLLGYAMRRIDDPSAAADVVAETFTTAWRRLDDVPNGTEARLWLYGTARRVLANYRRGERRRGALVDKLALHLQSAVPEPDVAALVVREALERLDSEDAELLRLTAWEGLSPTELARMWGIPAATVRTRLHRARQRLRGLLDGERSAPTGHVAGDGQPPVRGPEVKS